MPKKSSAGPTGNRLLNLLPPPERKSLEPLLREVHLELKQVLYEPRQPVERYYFPLNCALSAVAVMRDGHQIEVATVGNEGVSGLPTVTTITASPHRVFVQVEGRALVVDAARFLQEVQRLAGLAKTMAKYQQAFLYQISQCVACNGLHVLIERCCRWLLMTHDRVDGDEMTLTHEFLSYMLGVRRSGVTEVLQSLQSQGLIRYGNGNITVLKRAGLEDLACECYENVRDEYDRLLV